MYLNKTISFPVILSAGLTLTWDVFKLWNSTVTCNIFHSLTLTWDVFK